MRRWPWVVAAVALALTPLTVLLPDAETETVAGMVAAVLLMAGIGSLSLVGAVLATRVPGNSIGYLLLASGALVVGSSLASFYATSGTSGPGIELARILGETLFIYGIVITVVIVPLVFPSGTLLGPGWRWMVAILVAGMVALTLSVALGSESSFSGGARFPLGEPRPSVLMEALEAFNAVTAFIGLGGAVAATVIRFRRSRGIERQQMKWLVAVASVAALTMPPALVVPQPTVSNVLLLVALGAFALLPLAIGIAVLRYRLYDIDRIISRTIGWAVVTGLLVGAFALLVLGLTSLLEPLTGGNTLAVAGSTLVVVALFTPVRGRVQRAVDRRFDRGRYDGERTLAAFGERLRDEVDLDVIRTDVLATVETSVRPSRVGLWLRTPGGDTSDIDPVTIPGRQRGSMPS